jgi:hypothetical protein
VAELLDNALVTADPAVINDELTMTDQDQGSEKHSLTSARCSTSVDA